MPRLRIFELVGILRYGFGQWPLLDFEDMTRGLPILWINARARDDQTRRLYNRVSTMAIVLADQDVPFKIYRQWVTKSRGPSLRLLCAGDVE
jgi:hypothetical protein